MKKLFLPLTVVALSLSACGGGASAQAPSTNAAEVASPAAQPIACGTVRGAGGQAKVSVRQGNIDCAKADDLATRYFAALTSTDLTNPSGAGPVALDQWTCGSDAGSPLTATCSTENDQEIGTVPG